MSVQLKYSDETYQIIGAAMEVHKTIGCGFTEPLYQEAFEQELQLRSIPFQREKSFHVTYKGKELKKEFRPDLSVLTKSLWNWRLLAILLMNILLKYITIWKLLECRWDYL